METIQPGPDGAHRGCAMNKNISTGVFCLALVTAGAVPAAAPGQNYPSRPGEPTQAKVWIQNTPLRVVLEGTPTVAVSAAAILQARIVRQVWEYRTIPVASGPEALGALTAAGTQGWEAVGAPFQTANGTVLLLKRPR
jgi:hypothetical protein